MCALINLKAFTFVTPGEIVSSSLSIAFMVLGIVIPILLAFKICKHYKKLADEDIQNKFRAAYDELRLIKSDSNILTEKELANKKLIFVSMLGFFYLRRLLLGVTTVYMN